jgi:hypothetical protein
VADARFLRAPRSASPGLLESNPWRRLTISEHRETSFLIQRTYRAARRSQCKTARRPAATYLTVTDIVTARRVRSGCRLVVLNAAQDQSPGDPSSSSMTSTQSSEGRQSPSPRALLVSCSTAGQTSFTAS